MQKSVPGLLLVIAFLLGAIVFGMFTQRVQSQSPSPAAAPSFSAPSSAGRYQFIVEGQYGQGYVENIFDTQTGQIWWHDPSDDDQAKWVLEPPLPVSKPR